MSLTTDLPTQRCLHWGVCGGCRCKPGTEPPTPAPYREQIAEKEARVRELLAPFDVREWRPLVPSPSQWYYRNKMEFAFGSVPPNTSPIGARFTLGLREAGRFDRIVDVQTCLLMSPDAQKLVESVRAWAHKNNLAGYDRKFHRGDLRYLVVRESKTKGQRMAMLIINKTLPTYSTGEPLWQEFRTAAESYANTVWLGLSDTKGDVAQTQEMELLWGEGAIEEEINGITYRVSPYSFFQTNTLGCQKLYSLLQEWGKRIGGALIDFYCGTGGITLSLARSFDRVVGVDTNGDAIKDARAAAEANGLSNTEFVCSDSVDFLKKLPGSKLAVQLSAVVVDPPRPGLHPKALEQLIEMNPPFLAYVSCNPESLARDLQKLTPFYRIESLQLIDLFPNTPHVETLCLMEHR